MIWTPVNSGEAKQTQLDGITVHVFDRLHYDASDGTLHVPSDTRPANATVKGIEISERAGVDLDPPPQHPR